MASVVKNVSRSRRRQKPDDEPWLKGKLSPAISTEATVARWDLSEILLDPVWPMYIQERNASCHLHWHLKYLTVFLPFGFFQKQSQGFLCAQTPQNSPAIFKAVL